ncbi:DUF3592 domain-containing protein [Haloarchaeobius sp. DFWS5]|uniref:DUF3592 domain-containing protein n=1 Tax=Haloarchaeobius sp. DFWS5 TaxID=3446114 RepID=UPI003EBE6C47
MDIDVNGPEGPLQIGLMLVVGLGLIGYGGLSYTTQSSQLDSAVEVDATITETSIEEVDVKRGTDFTPHATFEYTYEGESYTSSKMYPGKLTREFNTKDDAREQLDGYDVGNTVTAYVPTDSPGSAYLEHSSSNKPLIVAGIGLFFFLASAYSIVT